MKKLLGIVVLGLLLSGNAYAASKFTYLSCPSIIYQNDNKGKFKDSESYKIGSYIGHYFIKFKDAKKEWTTVTLYMQGNNFSNPSDPDIWTIVPPKKLFTQKFLYVGGSYFFLLEDEEHVNTSWNINLSYDSSGDKLFVLTQNLVGLKEFYGIDLWTSSNHYINAKKVFDNNKFCEVLDKQEFNELKKIGIKINTETKSNDDLTTKSNDDLTQQLMNLNELYKSGALTKEEFEKAKKKLLD